MDSLTHSLLGLTLSKAGLEKLSPGATTVCILAANAPDIDFLSIFFGDRWTLLEHHRALTHSLIGVLALSLLIPSALWLVALLLSLARKQPNRLRLRGLLLASMIAGATHPLLDWTNSYGIRLLLPWSGKWFYGDLVFIADPFLWLLLGVAAFLLSSKTRWQLVLWSLFAAMLTFLLVYAGVRRGVLNHPAAVLAVWFGVLVAAAVCHRLQQVTSANSKVAFSALVLVLLYWTGLSLLHWRAIEAVQAEATTLAASEGGHVERFAAMPTLANPTRWQGVVETDSALYRFDVSVGYANGISKVKRFAKPTGIEAQVVESEERDRRARILLGFARFPVARVSDINCFGQTLVQIADIRYTEPGAGSGNFSLELPVDCPAGPQK